MLPTPFFAPDGSPVRFFPLFCPIFLTKTRKKLGNIRKFLLPNTPTPLLRIFYHEYDAARRFIHRSAHRKTPCAEHTVFLLLHIGNQYTVIYFSVSQEDTRVRYSSHSLRLPSM